MPNLYLDAVLFAAPEVGADDSALLHYVVQLVDLDNLRRSGSFPLLLSARTPEVLISAQSYPFWDRLPGAAFPQRGDLLRIIDAFLNKGTKVEEFLRIGDLLIDQQGCTPDSHLSGRPAALVEHHLYLLAFMCIDQTIHRHHGKPIVLTRGLNAAPAVISTSGTVVMFEWLKSASRIKEPFPYEGKFHACEGSGHVLAMLDPADLWIHERQLVPAMKIAVARLTGGAPEATCLTDASRFILGPQFEQSLLESGIEQSAARVRALLRACAETVLDVNLGATHALREGPEGNQPQINTDERRLETNQKSALLPA